jgi:hypothetical protein
VDRTELACVVAAYGEPGEYWRVDVKLRQRALRESWNDWTECGSWTECGVIDDDRCGGQRHLLPESPRMQLVYAAVVEEERTCDQV